MKVKKPAVESYILSVESAVSDISFYVYGFKMNLMLIQRKEHHPDFGQLLKVLRRERADRPVLFEFLIDDMYSRKYAGKYRDAEEGSDEYFLMVTEAYRNLGYDFAPVYAWRTNTLQFPLAKQDAALSKSQNAGALITDEATFETYPWPDPQQGDYDLYNRIGKNLPDGMKLMACSWGGILENVTDMVGFERLCMMYLLEPELTQRIFDHAGSRLLEYYRIVSAFDSVGFCTINDDWGFRTQTMFPPEMMQQFVYPWTRKMAELIHAAGKPVVFHSCGNLKMVMDDVIRDLKMDGKHSFEDAIYPVEDAYEWWHDEIAIFGGIDVDYLCQHSPEEIEQRAFRLLEQTFDRGGYALGSGNSIAHYVPEESMLAILRAAERFTKNLS